MSASSTSTGDLACMDELANSMNVSMQEFKQWSESLSDQIKKRDEESRKRARELQEAETALEKEEEVMREKDALGGQREALKEAQDRLSEEQASCQNLKERLASQQLKESDLARAIRFQASQFTSPSKDVDPEIVGKIVDMVKRSEASPSTINTTPTMPRMDFVKYRQTDRLQSRPIPVLDGLALRFGEGHLREWSSDFQQ